MAHSKAAVSGFRRVVFDTSTLVSAALRVGSLPHRAWSLSPLSAFTQLWFEVPEGDANNVQPPCRDPKDNPFLALAQRCDADVLSSSDADMLVLHPWNGVPILTPTAFLTAATSH